MIVRIYIICCAFILFDIATGYLCAIKEKNINSTKLREGLFHKLSELLALVGSQLLEYAITFVDIGAEIPFLNAVAAYICLTEVISILENLGELNPALKRFYGKYLEKLHDAENGVKEHDNGN